ncbi:FAD-dependent oxidoreductase [Daejeonella oryzae]|uniref:FAD-dependent oxidoreductase n=1 Tax=Daejeonella oryzae TaxID=1122943 RepID=UPI000415AD61|nr:FAD-dependent oxidoreductase [Daejeonella oryzae]
MNYKYSLIFLFTLFSIPSFSQTTRTDVVVSGNTAGALAAAIQASRSGVKTILLSSETEISTALTAKDIDYLNKIRNHFSGKKGSKPAVADSLLSKNLSSRELSQLIKGITDTVKNLTVLLNTDFRKIEKNGKGWEIKLTSGKSVKTDVLVDASSDFKASSLLNINPGKTILSLSASTDKNQYLSKVYRTSVGYGELITENGSRSEFPVPLASLLPSGIENFIIVPRGEGKFVPVSMSAGQAAGASAAFCAFFKTTTKNLNIRVIQGELLAFESRMVPFADIDFKDRDAMAFQHIALTGLINLKTAKADSTEQFIFDTLGTVSAAELRIPMKEFYSRSQIWFADNKMEELSIEDVINLFMFSVARGEELRKEIEKGWKDSFKFSTKYEPKRAINRREFAVLADKYLQPFNVRVDLSGNLMN